MPKTIKRLLSGLGILIVCILAYRLLVLRAFFLALLSMTGRCAIPIMIDALPDTGEPVRKVTVNHLAGVGAEAIPALLEALKSKDGRMGEGAVISLGRMVLRRKDAIPQLKKEVTPALITALEDEDQRVAVQAALALWRLNRQASEVVPTLIASWKSKDQQVRYVAADTLAEIGPEAKEAVPALFDGLRDNDRLVRMWAADALKAIDPEAATAAGVR